MIDNYRKRISHMGLGFFLFTLIYLTGVTVLPAQDTTGDTIKWYRMEEAQYLAKKNGKKVLAYAVTSWCVYCKKMNENVLPKQAVIDSLNAYFYPVKIMLDSNDQMVFNGQKLTAEQFARRFNVRATPTTIFIDDDGKIMGQQPGYIPADMFSRLLSFMGSDAFLKMNFKMYMQKYVESSDN